MKKWIDIEGYEGIYKMTIDGDVMSMPKTRQNPRYKNLTCLYKAKILKPYNRKGYLVVRLYSEQGVATDFLIHRLIATHFISNPEKKPQINHINGIRNDNRIENLEWVTCKENIVHCFRVLGKKNKKSSEHYYSKKVFQYSLAGYFIAEYPSVSDVMKETGLNKCIYECCAGAMKKAYGFIWSYEKSIAA